jgi:hypothetical protein
MMLACMSALKSIALAFGISILYFGLVFVGYAFTGAGHGSEYFGAALLAPFSTSEGFAMLGLMLWPVVGTLLAFRRFRSCQIAAAAILVLHYLGVVLLSFQTDWYYVGRVWHSMWPIVAAFVVVYLGSQIFMWVLITRRQHAG